MEKAIKFLPLCFFSNRLASEDYPASGRLLKNVLMLHFILGFLVVNQLIEPVEGALLMTAEILFTVLFVWLTTLLSKQSARFMKVMIAFIACANIIAVISFPFAFWLNIVENERVHLPFYIAAALMLWYLAVVGFLLHRFLDIKPVNCLILTIVYFLFAYVGAFGFLFM